MKNKLAIILTVFCISCFSVYGQLSEGGLPPSFNYTSNLRSTSLPLQFVPVDVDIERLKWEDEIAEKNGSPLRVAEVLPVNVDIKTSGEWTTLPDSTKIWRQSVTAEDAQGLFISYEDFYIPKGGKLFIYNKDQSQVLGAYTYETHPQGGQFATELVYGDSFTLEYVSSTKSTEEPRIVIESVGYMYKNILAEDYEPIINSPNLEGRPKCRININCIDGQNWQNQKRGVVLYFIYWNLAGSGPGWYACSGSLINNTKHDATPYMLSAFHCFLGDPTFNSVITYFNFEFSGCEDEYVTPKYQTLVGVEPLVQIPINGGSDHFLVKMKDNIPLDYKPFFNGWDRRNIAAQSGVVIHHPNRDVKKIATYSKATVSATYAGGDYKGATNAFWNTGYNINNATEKGSSGSPLFNQNGLIVGTLTGGASQCQVLDSADSYGKIWYGWDQYPNDLPYEQQLKVYLDPLNTGTETLGGYDPNGLSGIEEEFINDKKDLVLFPNPVDSELNVSANDIIRKISVYNLQGRCIFSQSGNSASTAIISTSTLNKGVYTITIETDNKKLSDKFFKK